MAISNWPEPKGKKQQQSRSPLTADLRRWTLIEKLFLGNRKRLDYP